MNSLRISRSLTTRLFSSERAVLNVKDVEIVKNPGKEYIDSLSKKARESKENIKLLRETMGDNYNLYALCLKNSKEIISAAQSIQYKSLTDGNDFQSWGLTYNDANYQKVDVFPHLIEKMSQDLSPMSVNSGACIETFSSAIWRKYIGMKVRGVSYYVSNYDAKDLVNPDLDFENIVVKPVSDASSSDLLKYDQTIFPYERSKYILAKFKDGYGRVAYDKDGKVIGVGLISSISNGNCTIGPLYCDNRQVAQAIFQSILEEIPLKDLKNIQIRCSDKFEDSATWIRPFLCRRHEMILHSFVKFNRIIPDGLNLSKVFVNSNPINAPC